MTKMSLLVFNVLIIVGCAFAVVPSYINLCSRNDPNLNECVKKSVESLREKIRDGMPELDVPAGEPFLIPEGLPLADSPDLRAYARDIKLYGIPNFKINNINVDLDNKKIDIAVHFDELKLEGDYDVSAKILVALNGKGPIEIEARDIDGAAVMKYQTKKTKKGQRMFFSSMSLKLKIKDFSSKFVPRDGSDDTFGGAVNAVINGNRQEIIAGVQPALEKAVTTKILELANKICKNFTFEELFPETV